MTERRDPYRILQVQPGADPDVVRAAYRVLARKLHPDGAAGPMDPATERKMADLNWAYAIVRDPVRLQAWESERRRAAPPTPRQDPTHGAPRGPLDADGADLRLDFGRYEGWTLGEVVRRDPEYLDWLRRHASGARYRDAIDVLLRKHRYAR
jgi:curved DNA-binding protein CbpA